MPIDFEKEVSINLTVGQMMIVCANLAEITNYQSIENMRTHYGEEAAEAEHRMDNTYEVFDKISDVLETMGIYYEGAMKDEATSEDVAELISKLAFALRPKTDEGN